MRHRRGAPDWRLMDSTRQTEQEPVVCTPWIRPRHRRAYSAASPSIPSTETAKISFSCASHTSEWTTLHSKSPAIWPGISHTASSFLLSAKSHAWFACSVVNALTTLHRRYQLFAGYDSSNPTSEKSKKSKKSFSCAFHKHSPSITRKSGVRW